MIIRFKTRHKSLYVTALSLISAGWLLRFSGFDGLTIAIVLALLVVLLRYATRPLSVLIAQSRYSIRFKFEVVIIVMGVMFLLVSLFSFAAMDFMHQRLHAILELGTTNPSVVLRAVDRLEDTQHSLLFSLTPALSILGVVAAAVLSSAMALSVIDAVGKMGSTMRRMAAGDFSERLVVYNRDELGELAEGINEAAQDLVKSQEMRLAQERASALREQIARVTLAQEEERKRIARELHDELGPSLAALGNRLTVLRPVGRLDASDASMVGKELDEVAASLRKHVGEIRELIYDLRPPGLDQIGLIGSLRQHIDRFQRDSGIKTTFIAEHETKLDPLEDVTVFRIVQECLNNIGKHSAAKQAEVTISQDDEGLSVSVTDNGVGFSQQHASANGGRGMGMLSMQERAELIGATLNVVTGPGSGCKVTLRLPRKEAHVGNDARIGG